MNPKRMTLQTVLIIVLIGLTAGMLSGLIGVGGGIIIVPALVFFLGFSQHQAIGTSLGILLLPAGILAVVNYYKKGFIDLKVVLILFIGYMVGSYFGSNISLNVSQDILKKLFAVTLVIVAVKMLFFEK
jgi:uncharacterized membrane protein YfcA